MRISHKSNKLTICIPVYNSETYIINTLNSILKNKKKYCVLIYNDGSTDNTSNMIKKYIDKHNLHAHWYFYDCHENNGIGYSRDFLLKKIKSEFFMWLDSDDELFNSGLDKIEVYIDKKYDCIIGKNYFKIKDNPLQQLFNFNMEKSNNRTRIILSQNIIQVWGKIWKTSFYKKNYSFINVRIGEDILLIPQLMFKAKLYYSNSELYIWNRRDGSLSFLYNNTWTSNYSSALNVYEALTKKIACCEKDKTLFKTNLYFYSVLNFLKSRNLTLENKKIEFVDDTKLYDEKNIIQNANEFITDVKIPKSLKIKLINSLEINLNSLL